MPDRIDGYLSRIAQAHIDPRALIMLLDGTAWVIRIPGAADLGIGGNRGEADQAVRALIRARRAGAA